MFTKAQADDLVKHSVATHDFLSEIDDGSAEIMCEESNFSAYVLGGIKTEHFVVMYSEWLTEDL